MINKNTTDKVALKKFINKTCNSNIKAMREQISEPVPKVKIKIILEKNSYDK